MHFLMKANIFMISTKLTLDNQPYDGDNPPLTEISCKTMDQLENGRSTPGCLSIKSNQTTVYPK